MMKDRKNKGKKTLAAVSAVVVAGLTPGAIAASAAGAPLQGSNAGITAADVVAMDGNTYGFDELYAMQRGDTVETQVELPEIQVEAWPRATKYGASWLSSSRAEADGDGDTVFHSVEQMPRFPGGEAALMKYIDSHIIYPPSAVQNRVQGKVIVQFIVKKDSSIGEVKVVRSVDKDLDKEAIRVVKSLPKFTPGRQNGQVVSVWYTLPVTFKLK
jgi:TonB family protein